MLNLNRSTVWSTALLFSAGLAIGAFGLWSIASWHANAARGELVFGLERIQYDTAWAFTFVGASLISFANRLAALTRLFAALPIALGALRLVAYLAPGTVPVRPILAIPWLPFGAGAYNDMGVLTALMLIALGCALALLRPAVRGPVRSVFLTLVAAITLALALLLFVGASTGGAAAIQWLLLTGGDRTNAALAMLASGALLVYALFGTADERRAVWRWAPGIVGFAVFACVLVLWRALALHEAHLVQRSSQLVATNAGRQIELDLDRRIRSLTRLAERVRIYAMSPQEWQQDASMILRDRNEFQVVDWIDDRLFVRWAEPVGTPDAPGFDVGADPARGPAIAAAVSSRRATLTPFFDTVQGGNRFAVFVPVFDGETLRGVVGATLGGNAWFQGLLKSRFPEYQVDLDEQGKPVGAVAGDGPAAGAEWAYERPLRIANAEWILRVTPTVEHLRTSGSALPEAALALGALLAALLALCTFLFQTAYRRANALAAANAQLIADIAARERAESALSESEQRTRLIVDALKDCAIYMLDPEGRIASWNRGAAGLTGFSEAEALGRHFSLLYPSGRDDPAPPRLANAVHEGSLDAEGWHQRRDGSRFRGEDIIAAICDDSGALRGFAVVTRDATQQIELREQTERSRDFYLALFSDIPNLIWRSDANGACDYVNNTWLEYTGCPRETQYGDGWQENLHVDDRVRWRDVFQRSMATQQPFEIEFRLRHADRTWGSMICSARPYHDMQGHFSGFLCSCYDNTARRAMETALKESEARYEGMTSNVPGMVFQLVRDVHGAYSFAYVSPGCEPLTGIGDRAVIRDAEAFFALIPQASRPQLAATLDASARQMSNWNWNGPLLPAHGTTEKWVTIRARPRRVDGGLVMWDGLVFDDTQNRLAQLEIERSREELRALSRHLQSVREEEKARIAREIHDELGSTLTALKMDLDWLGRRLPENMAPRTRKAPRNGGVGRDRGRRNAQDSHRPAAQHPRRPRARCGAAVAGGRVSQARRHEHRSRYPGTRPSHRPRARADVVPYFPGSADQRCAPRAGERC